MEMVERETTFKKYPAYKDSGVEWLGEIPIGWSILSAKRFHKVRKELNRKRVCDNVLSLTLRGVVNNNLDKPEGLVPKDYATYQVFEKNDLVFKLIDLENISTSRVGLVHEKGIMSSAYIRLVIGYGCLPKYAYYYYFSLYKNEVYNKLGSGVRSTLGPNDILNLPFLKPNLQEQTAIANFLDDKTAKIDTAIAQKEKMIALLKERKQIMIQNAVTGKWSMVNGKWEETPKEKMKDSGVEWIGEIPEGWEVKALKYIAMLESGETISSANFIKEGYPVYGGNGFRGYTQNYTNDGHYALIGRQGALCGNINYAKGKFFASEHAIVVYHKHKVNVTWLGETIKAANFNRLSQSAAQPGIAVNVVKNILFPYPSIDEQNEIELYIKTQSSKTEHSVSLQQTQIEKLKEYKSILIDSAVTGKIKVS